MKGPRKFWITRRQAAAVVGLLEKLEQFTEGDSVMRKDYREARRMAALLEKKLEADLAAWRGVPVLTGEVQSVFALATGTRHTVKGISRRTGCGLKVASGGAWSYVSFRPIHNISCPACARTINKNRGGKKS